MEAIEITTGRGQTALVRPGDFVQETLFTDTILYEVLKVTWASMTIRSTTDAGTVHQRNVDGNPYPIVYTAVKPSPTGEVRMRRVRKDGTVRVLQGGSPLRPAHMIDGVPVRRTDYRY